MKKMILLLTIALLVIPMGNVSAMSKKERGRQAVQASEAERNDPARQQREAMAEKQRREEQRRREEERQRFNARIARK